VSHLAPGRDISLPRFVSLKGDDQEIAEAEQPLWVGAQHRAYVPDHRGLKTLELTRQVDLSRLRNRKELLTQLDILRREVDASGEMGAFDAFSAQALDMLTSGKARRAFDLSDEKPETLDRYRAGDSRFVSAPPLFGVAGVVNVAHDQERLWSAHGAQTLVLSVIYPRMLPGDVSGSAFVKCKIARQPFVR
jgi:hypothetical protein